MHKKYRKLLFDLDNTLVDDDKNREYAIGKMLADMGEEVTHKKIQKFIEMDNKFWIDRSAGRIKDPYEFKSNEEQTKWLRAERIKRYFGDMSLEKATELNTKYVDLLREKAFPIENSSEILKYLFDKGYEIYIITNGPKRAVKDKAKGTGGLEYIREIFAAEEVGYMKPKREYFNGFFEKINCYDTSEMLIIGDELEKDILGGMNNNIDTCWFNRRGEKSTGYKVDYEIKDLLELKEIL